MKYQSILAGLVAVALAVSCSSPGPPASSPAPAATAEPAPVASETADGSNSTATAATTASNASSIEPSATTASPDDASSSSPTAEAGESPSELTRVLGKIPASFKSQGIWFSHPARALELAGQPRMSMDEFLALPLDEKRAYLDPLGGAYIAHSWVMGKMVNYLIEWPETFGFDYLNVALSVSTGERTGQPLMPAYLEGVFDEAAVNQKLLDLGYEEREFGGLTYYGIRGDYRIDPLDPAGGIALNSMNRVFVSDDVIIASPAAEHVEAILEASTGQRLSLADDSAFSSLAKGLDGTLSAGLLTRSSVLGSDEAKAVVYEKPDEWGTLRQWEAAGFAYGAGEDGTRWQAVALYYPDPGAAEMDAEELVKRMQDYTSGVDVALIQRGWPEMPLQDCDTWDTASSSNENGSVLVARCPLAADRHSSPLFSMVAARDLGFLLP